jgi:hypothetical protein
MLNPFHLSMQISTAFLLVEEGSILLSSHLVQPISPYLHFGMLGDTATREYL